MSASQAGAAAPVKSAMRTLDVIEFVVAHPQGVIAQEIAAALGIPVSSLSYLLATLAEREYLARQGRRYLPGPGWSGCVRPCPRSRWRSAWHRWCAPCAAS
jgi:IclR family acetate operon transcriptional repressor